MSTIGSTPSARETPLSEPQDHSRRQFSRALFGGTLALASLRAYADVPDTRELKLYNIHTDELCDICYWIDGAYQTEGLASIDYLMRDYRANEIKPLDIALIETLYILSWKLNTGKPIHVLSGYRTEATNSMLRKRSKGVARYSLHMEARAADIVVPGVSLSTLHEQACSLERGGVGLYSRSGFVHIDVGRIRYWGS